MTIAVESQPREIDLPVRRSHELSPGSSCGHHRKIINLRGTDFPLGTLRAGSAGMNISSILLWGFVATILLTSLTVAAQSLGLTRVDIPFIIGTMFTPNRDRAKVIGL